MVRYQNSQLDSDVGRSQASNQNDYFVDLGGGWRFVSILCPVTQVHLFNQIEHVVYRSNHLEAVDFAVTSTLFMNFSILWGFPRCEKYTCITGHFASLYLSKNIYLLFVCAPQDLKMPPGGAKNRFISSLPKSWETEISKLIILIAWTVGLGLGDANVRGRGKDRGGTEITKILLTKILFCVFYPRKYLFIFPRRSPLKRRWLVGYQFCQKVGLFLEKWSEIDKQGFR